MSKPTKTDNKAMQAAFLLAYKENYGNVSKACKQVRMCRDSYYDWKKKKSFRKKLDKTNAILVQELESLAVSRSFEGSDTMLKFLLTKLCPEKYGDKLILEGEGTFEKLVMEIYAERKNQETEEVVSPKTIH